jgi:hypothetical protein
VLVLHRLVETAVDSSNFRRLSELRELCHANFTHRTNEKKLGKLMVCFWMIGLKVAIYGDSTVGFDI